MRPELGSEDMEEAAWDPTDLFLDVGMLVVEARIPDNSPKGRIEGPHVPPMSGAYPHNCDKHREQCRKADHLRKQMLLFSRNGIPMRIDVILLPNCDHGQQEASAVEGTYLPSTDDVLLLERWDVQIQQKRCEKVEPSSVTGRVLLQAIRSYLHFSQLSSWLISNRGYLPLQIVFRFVKKSERILSFLKYKEGARPDKPFLKHAAQVYAPGENVNQSFSSLPDIHLFPVADLRTSLVRVGVSSLPRLQTIPQLKCKEETNFFNKIPVRKKISPEKEKPTNLPKLDSLLKEPKSWSKKTEELRRTSPELFEEINIEEKKSRESLGAIPKKSRSHSHATDTTPLDENLLQRKPPIYKASQKEASDLTASHLGISHPSHIPHTNSKYHLTKTSTENTIPNKPMPLSQLISEFKPLDLRSPIDPQYLNMRLPSPKVLFTQSASSNQSYCKKKELDFDSPPLEQKVEDRLMTEKISDLVKPLNSEELEAYLSSLSHPLKEKPTARAELSNIPITKCKFYIGDGDKSHISTSNDISLQNIKCNLFPDYSHIEEKQLVQDNGQNAHDPISTSNDSHSPTLPATLPPRNTFKKSFSEPGLHVDKLSVYQLELSTSPDERLCDLDSTLARSFQDLPFFDKENSENGCSSDSSSTPTNSLSERNGAMSKYLSHTSNKLHNTGLSRESTPTSELISNKYKVSVQDQGCDHSSFKPNVPSLSEHNENIKNAQKKSSNAFLYDDLRNEDSGSRAENKGSSLCKQLLQKELKKNIDDPFSNKDRVPDSDKIRSFHKSLSESSAMMFHSTTGLPSRSSPAPIKKKSSKRFDYDDTLMNTRAIKNALSCSKLTLQSECRTTETNPEDEKVLSASAPASTNCLLGNFEESVLNGRIEPVGVVEGFTCEIGAGGSFCPKHLSLPVTAYFFQLSDDNAPSPYLGHINLEPLGKKGYHIPKRGTVQVTLFNPNKTVVKMFVVMYDLSEMPANCQTFLRQRTMYMPVDRQSCQPSYLRYLIHLRFATTRSGKLYLHTDIRLIFARDKFEFDPNIAKYELRSFTEGPENPKFSPKR